MSGPFVADGAGTARSGSTGQIHCAEVLAVWLRDLLGGLSDEPSSGDVVWSCSTLWLRVAEFAALLEALGDDLVRCLAVEGTLAAAVIGGIEATEQLLKLGMRVDGDTEHLAADAAIEALHHAVGLRRVRLGMSVLRAKLRADLGKGGGEATAVVGQHMGEAEGEGGRGLAEKGDGALLGLVVLDGKVDGARAPVDGDVEVALAPLAVGGLQLWQVLDVDVDEAEV